eukprot:TRINITY_DN6580_c1_g3_i3.p1 TRINITY_DN6580_c1_g3~~TRINITY_DN6580_c1_g3_i3.p1  ORF type:complete len:614 (-),score=230.31 TRINITY_DN6580_c1_g3_i3:68-1909(-)
MEFNVDERVVTLTQLVEEATNEVLEGTEDFQKYLIMSDLINNCSPLVIEKAITEALQAILNGLRAKSDATANLALNLLDFLIKNCSPVEKYCGTQQFQKHIEELANKKFNVNKTRQENLLMKIQEWAYTYLNNKNYHYWPIYMNLKKTIHFPPPEENILEKTVKNMKPTQNNNPPPQQQNNPPQQRDPKLAKVLNSLVNLQENIGLAYDMMIEFDPKENIRGNEIIPVLIQGISGQRQSLENIIVSVTDEEIVNNALIINDEITIVTEMFDCLMRGKFPNKSNNVRSSSSYKQQQEEKRLKEIQQKQNNPPQQHQQQNNLFVNLSQGNQQNTNSPLFDLLNNPPQQQQQKAPQQNIPQHQNINKQNQINSNQQSNSNNNSNLFDLLDNTPQQKAPQQNPPQQYQSNNFFGINPPPQDNLPQQRQINNPPQQQKTNPPPKQDEDDEFALLARRHKKPNPNDNTNNPLIPTNTNTNTNNNNIKTNTTPLTQNKTPSLLDLDFTTLPSSNSPNIQLNNPFLLMQNNATPNRQQQQNNNSLMNLFSNNPIPPQNNPINPFQNTNNTQHLNNALFNLPNNQPNNPNPLNVTINNSNNPPIFGTSSINPSSSNPNLFPF